MTIKHRSRARYDPTQPNLRQVHLIQAELLDELRVAGFAIRPGQMGENVTTSGIELLALPTGTRLTLGDSAVIELTGLRDPCIQLDRFQPGLRAAVQALDERGKPYFKKGAMAVVFESGTVRPGDSIRIEIPREPHSSLQKV